MQAAVSMWCMPCAGAMNGLFSKLSMTEIRSRPGLCAAAACTKPCHKVSTQLRSHARFSLIPSDVVWCSVLCWCGFNANSSHKRARPYKLAVSHTVAVSQANCFPTVKPVQGAPNFRNRLAHVCAAILQGRIEHETVEAPCSNPAGCTAPASFSISSLLPWSNSNNSSCAGGDNSCSSCGYTMPSVSASQPQEGFSTPSVYSCSAVLDMYPTAADVGSGVTVPAGADAGVMAVEREVVLPGCPMNSYPGKNIDNHVCIMCGECQNSLQGTDSLGVPLGAVKLIRCMH